MTNSDRFAQIYDHLPTAGDKRLFLAGFLGAISNHLSKETMQRCIEVALKVAADSPQRAHIGTKATRSNRPLFVTSIKEKIHELKSAFGIGVVS